MVDVRSWRLWGRQHRIRKLRQTLSTQLALDSTQEKQLDVFLGQLNAAENYPVSRRWEVQSKAVDLLMDPRFDRRTAEAVVYDLTAGVERSLKTAISAFGELYDGLDECQRRNLRSMANR